MMEKHSQHVILYNGQLWAVKNEGAKEPSATFSSKLEAVIHARKIAEEQHTELIIYGRDGRIQEIDSYERIPNVAQFARG